MKHRCRASAAALFAALLVAITCLASSVDAQDKGTDSFGPTTTGTMRTPPAADAAPASLFSVRAARYGETDLEGGHFTYDVEPGTALVDQLEVTNTSNRPLSVHVYPADMLQVPGGGLAPAQEDAPRDEVGAWLRVETPVIGVPPGETVQDPFAVKVPDGTVPGEYTGAVVAAVRPDPSSAGRIGVETRAALLVRVRVPGEARPGVAVGSLRTRTLNGRRMFEVDVKNTGNVLFTVTGEIDIERGGHRIADVPVRPSDIYVIPDGKAGFSAVWNRPPAFGRYVARARFHIAINGKSIGDYLSPPVTVTALPLRAASIVGVGILTLAGLITIVTRRRRRSRAERHALISTIAELKEREALSSGHP
jgi:hypothetical protein